MIKNLLLSSGMSFFLSFSSLILISRVFELDFIADVKSVTLFIGWISTILSFQIHTAFLYFYGKKGYDDNRFFVLIFTLISLLSIISSTVFYFLIDYVYESITLNNIGKFTFSLICATNLIFISSPAIFSALKETESLTKFTIGYLIASLISLVITWLLKLDVNDYALIQLLLQITSIFISPWKRFIHRYLINIRSFSLIGYYAVYIYARNISFSGFLDTISSKVDKFFAAKFTSQFIFAKYAVLSFENPLINVLLSSYGIKLIKTYQNGISKNYQEFVKEWRSLVKIITFTCFPIGLFFFHYAEDVVMFIFGERYLSGVDVFKFYSLVCFVRFAPFQIILRIENMTKLNVVISSIFVVSSVSICSAIIYYELDYVYLGSSYLVGWFLFNFFAVIFANRYCSINPLDILCLDIVVPRIILSALSLALVVFIGNENLLTNVFVFGISTLILFLITDEYIRGLFKLLFKGPMP